MPLQPGTKVPPGGYVAGDHSPIFALEGGDGSLVYSHGDPLAGRPLLLVLCRAPSAASGAFLRSIANMYAQLAGCEVHVLAATAADRAELESFKDSLRLPFELLLDGSAEVLNIFTGPAVGPDDRIVVLIDQNRRIVSLRQAGPEAIQPVLAEIEVLVATPRVLKLDSHPPVLVLPRVLNTEDCELLVDMWHRPVRLWRSDGLTNSGYANETGDFKVRIDSYGRTDQYVVRDPEVQSHIDRRVSRRVLPEIAKSFNVGPAYREDYRIACYDSAERGGLPRHRDNPGQTTRHRLFTISINLNAGEYEGGALRFREYGDQLYEVERGTAIVWSCSLLHEVTEVTRGRRFMLGTHIFSDLNAAKAAYSSVGTAAASRP
jgi:peroxiredoxin